MLPVSGQQQTTSSPPVHLIFFDDGKAKLLCRCKKNDEFRTCIYPQTNCVKNATCPDCLVMLDSMVESGDAAVRKDTDVVVYANECGHMLTVTTFIQFLKDEKVTTFDKNDLRELAENTGISISEISKQLKENEFKLVPPKDAEKAEYTFNSGGTFGFGGLR